MNKLVLLLPLFLITMCGEAPVTPPAQACSPRLDGGLTICPDPDLPLPKPKPLIPTQEVKGEIDVWNPHHLMNLQMMFERNKRREDIERSATKPSDAINSALDNFWEKQDGSNGSTK
jgi:hypothetical protein